MTRLLVTYMEQTAAPAGPVLASPVAGVSINQERPQPEDYLQLYRDVGAPLQWDERLRIPGEQLASFLCNPSTAIFILRNRRKAIGLCEFYGIGGREVELQHFGLVPAAQGRRLGPFLLDWALRTVWQGGPARVWLHTDTNDHPRAKATYEKSGFAAYAEVWEEFPD